MRALLTVGLAALLASCAPDRIALDAGSRSFVFHRHKPVEMRGVEHRRPAPAARSLHRDPAWLKQGHVIFNLIWDF